MIAVRLDGKNQRPVGWPDSHSGVWRLIAAAHGLVSSFGWLLRLSRSLSQFETQDIKTQPQFNHYIQRKEGAEARLNTKDY